MTRANNEMNQRSTGDSWSANNIVHDLLSNPAMTRANVFRAGVAKYMQLEVLIASWI
jgi:hypothetical protein